MAQQHCLPTVACGCELLRVAHHWPRAQARGPGTPSPHAVNAAPHAQLQPLQEHCTPFFRVPYSLPSACLCDTPLLPVLSEALCCLLSFYACMPLSRARCNLAARRLLVHYIHPPGSTPCCGPAHPAQFLPPSAMYQTLLYSPEASSIPLTLLCVLCWPPPLVCVRQPCPCRGPSCYRQPATQPLGSHRL